MILILLPAYNEEESLPVLMPKTQKNFRLAWMKATKFWSVMMVVRIEPRKCSKNMLGIMPLEIIKHKINRGLGESSRDLFERAAELVDAGDVIVRLDCDDTHEPEFIPSIVEKVRSGYDVVIASRFAPGGGQMGVDGYRAFISRGANLFMKFFFPILGLKNIPADFEAIVQKKFKRRLTFWEQLHPAQRAWIYLHPGKACKVKVDWRPIWRSTLCVALRSKTKQQ